MSFTNVRGSGAIALAACLVLGWSMVLEASQLTLSIGVRETGSAAAIGADGGTGGGIEWVDLDANVVPADAGWHQVTVDLANAPLTAFAGGTANGAYDTATGTIEHIRILNSGGITSPITMFLDDLIYTDPNGGATLLGWEGLPVATEHIFQEPGFSGSTSGNLTGPNSSLVSEAMAFSGTQSYQLDFQYLDNDPTRWVRLTTFATASGGNPTIGFDGTLTFQVKVIPEPASLLMAAFAVMGIVGTARRR